GNQVYMQYEVTPAGSKELSLKVLDMGMGQERNAWFTNGNTTSYESTFPTVMKRLYLTTGVKPDQALMKRFLPYSAQLNVDETKDLEKAWKAIAESLGEDSGSLRERILPLSALFSVAEHSRSLLFALSDGALPSNSSGGYNLRLILRRALAFIDRYNWDIDLAELCRLHAGYLSGQFPELSDNLDDVARVLEVEKQKYRETRARSKQITSRLISRNVTTDSLVRLYDSNGITPGLVAEEAARIGKKITIPDDFYARLGELHEKGADKRGEIRADETDPVVAGLGSGVPKTIISYYEDKKTDHSRVLGVYDCGKAYVLLESTIFYPTGGGQNSDQGYINREFVDAAIKNAGYVFHRINKKAADIPFKVGDTVELKLDDARRLQLSQHHTAAHIINGSARAVLGNHIWQAGAAKDVDKARLDITHYQQLSDDDVKRIEGLANEIVEKNIVINKFVERRDIAEKRFGFRLYQGGAVPGLEIRVVEIPSFDVEACGGTHLDFTGQVGRIRILRTVKIQDGVVRLEFVAGRAAEEAASEMQSMLREAGRLLGCKPEQVPARADELFSKWKQAVKKHCKVDKKLTSTEFFKGDALGETCRILRTQPEHVNKTIRRFLKELEQA
ncbi:TPA: alanine--tRNA ligase, partial [Candidatus Woesearchaeota archaeon]|nr:alanine--tRNA ligase [Candidatus Woesearchaeota archaeon]